MADIYVGGKLRQGLLNEKLAQADELEVSASGFSGNLDNTINDVQLLANAVDDLTVSGGTDADAIHDNVSGEINAVAEKSILVDDDIILIEDSADSFSKKKSTVAGLMGGADTAAADQG